MGSLFASSPHTAQQSAAERGVKEKAAHALLNTRTQQGGSSRRKGVHRCHQAEAA